MNISKFGLSIIFLSIFAIQCSEKVDLAKEIEAIRKIEEARNNSVLSNDPELSLAFKATHRLQIGCVEEGKFIPTKEFTRVDSSSVLKMFDKTRYKKIEQLTPRIIRVSKDGTMAWVITHEKLTMGYIRNYGDEWKEFEYNEAALIVYEKLDGKWKMFAESFSHSDSE